MRILACLLVLAGAAACSDDSVHRPVPPVKETGEVVMLTVHGPTTWTAEAPGEATGLEHDLALRFAREAGWKLRVEFVTSETELIPALEARRGHFAAGSLVPSPSSEARVRFGPPYQTLRQQVVWRTDQPRPTGPADLARTRVAVLAGSHQADLLKELTARVRGLSWEEIEHAGPDDLLRSVAEGRFDAAIVDSHWFSVARNFYANLGVAFDLGPPVSLAWAFPQSGDEAVYREARKFFERIRKDGSLARLVERYYGNLRPLDRNDIQTFLERRETLLPRYRDLFHQAQEATGIDWRMIAALAYQESHWEPSSTSPTGVRGMMMLTGETADRLGVKNRLDPREDIRAGARYLAMLKDGLAGRVPEPDRTWLAIAAYNIGMGGLESARLLAQRQKLNPNSWSDVRKVLPLLASAEYAGAVPSGFARGGEALATAENVRQYYEILVRFERAHRPALAVDAE